VRGGIVAGATIGFLLIVGAAALGSESDYPDVPANPDGTVTDPVEVGEPGLCPNDEFIPEGSVCQRQAIGNGEYSNRIVEWGEFKPPCELASPPLGTEASSCRELSREPTEDGEGYTGAMVSYSTLDGAVVRVWVFPGGEQIILS
jgi:hypothetical protein